ncbi:MAG: tRNA preQ1(34) S-adenosylmethionine ribosyltransferase-isomerase QueA, partial [Vampirovibrionales bacterium]
PTGMACEVPEGAKVLKAHLHPDDFSAMHLTAPPTMYDLMALYGTIPIPPYFKREATEADKTRYQTVYAETPGSQAAPTAGLHFTPELLMALNAKGIDHTFITLDVGIGTFRPVSVTDIRTHQLHAERYTVTEATAQKIRATKQAGGRIIAVGTTSVRTLETVARLADEQHPYLKASSGESALYIYPGFEFKLVEGLMTNFHLPESSLLMLVSALIGRQRLLALYQTAVALNYRFFSYGDCCLIVPVG